MKKTTFLRTIILLLSLMISVTFFKNLNRDIFLISLSILCNQINQFLNYENCHFLSKQNDLKGWKLRCNILEIAIFVLILFYILCGFYDFFKISQIGTSTFWHSQFKWQACLSWYWTTSAKGASRLI